MIALLCAVQVEAELFLSRMAVKHSETLGYKSIIRGSLEGHDAALCIGGMGKVNAAHAATLMLSRYKTDALIVFGIGGAYPGSGANVGDIAIAKEEIAGDEGIMTRDGFRDTEFIGIPLIKTAASTVYTTYPASDLLLKRALQAIVSGEQTQSIKAHLGAFVTLSTCTGTTARAQELEARYHALCENMEGAAAVQVAELHQVPWLEVRGISNVVEDRATEKWDIPRAATAAQKAVLRILDIF